MTFRNSTTAGYIDINPGYEAPKYGYDETMSCYLLDLNLDSIRELLPDGYVPLVPSSSASPARNESCFLGCSNQGTGIRFRRRSPQRVSPPLRAALPALGLG